MKKAFSSRRARREDDGRVMGDPGFRAAVWNWDSSQQVGLTVTRGADLQTTTFSDAIVVTPSWATWTSHRLRKAQVHRGLGEAVASVRWTDDALIATAPSCT